MLLGILLPLCGAPLTITSNGDAAGHIAIDVNAPRPVQFAASELQNYLRKITTARYPVQHNADVKGATVFILGTKDCSFIKPFMDEKIVEAVKKLMEHGGCLFMTPGKNATGDFRRLLDCGVNVGRMSGMNGICHPGNTF